MDTFSGLIRLKSYGLGKLNGTLSLKGLSKESKMQKVLSNADTVARIEVHISTFRKIFFYKLERIFVDFLNSTMPLVVSNPRCVR